MTKIADRLFHAVALHSGGRPDRQGDRVSAKKASGPPHSLRDGPFSSLFTHGLDPTSQSHPCDATAGRKPKQPDQHFFLVAVFAAFFVVAAFLVAAPLAAFFATV